MVNLKGRKDGDREVPASITRMPGLLTERETEVAAQATRGLGRWKRLPLN